MNTFFNKLVASSTSLKQSPMAKKTEGELVREAMRVASASTRNRKIAAPPFIAPKAMSHAAIVEPEREYAHHGEDTISTPPAAAPTSHAHERLSPPLTARHAPDYASAPPVEEDEGELTVDIYDHGDSIIIQSTVAGVMPDDLDVTVTNDTVTIRGRRTRPENISDDAYYYKELFWGTFSRSVLLPEEIEEEIAEASLIHGLLTLRLPKKRRGVVQKVKVKAL